MDNEFINNEENAKNLEDVTRKISIPDSNESNLKLVNIIVASVVVGGLAHKYLIAPVASKVKGKIKNWWKKPNYILDDDCEEVDDELNESDK